VSLKLTSSFMWYANVPLSEKLNMLYQNICHAPSTGSGNGSSCPYICDVEMTNAKASKSVFMSSVASDYFRPKSLKFEDTKKSKPTNEDCYFQLLEVLTFSMFHSKHTCPGR